MTQLSKIQQKLQQVGHEIRFGTPETQDVAITGLYNQLEDLGSKLFPSFLYPLLIDILNYYCTNIIPNLKVSDEAQNKILETFEHAIHEFNNKKQIAENLESDIRGMFLQVKAGKYKSVENILALLSEFVLKGNKTTPLNLKILNIEEVEKQHRMLKKAAFTSSQVIPFFEALLAKIVPEQFQQQFKRIELLFWHQLNELLQMKTALINVMTGDVIITPFEVETSLVSKGFDMIDFDNEVDQAMYDSCWNAVKATRIFLEEYFPNLSDHFIRVKCNFPNPIATYNDSSVSLLIGLKVIGDFLNMEINPNVLVVGEVDESGRVLPVSNVVTKIQAVEKSPNINQIYIPQGVLSLESEHTEVIKVQTLSEAVQHYYGEQLKKKNRLFTHRQLLKGVLGFSALGLGLLKVTKLFAHPVSEQDWWALEYARELYQQFCNYSKAENILQAIVKKFDDNSISTEVESIKLQAFQLLGQIYKQQAQPKECFYSFQRAFELSKSLHDKHTQATVLLLLGDVYLDIFAIDEINKNIKISLQYFNDANDIIDSSMKTFKQLKGKYYQELGRTYYLIENNELARPYLEKSLSILDKNDTCWDYQVSKHFLGILLNRFGKYDEAIAMLHATSQSSVLQNPWGQAKSFSGFCELYLTRGEYQTGIEFANKATELCKEYGITGLYKILQKILAKHLPSSIIGSF